MLEAADLAVAPVAEQLSQVSLAQTGASPKEPNVRPFGMSHRFHAFRQPSFFSILELRRAVRQNDGCADLKRGSDERPPTDVDGRKTLAD